MSAKILLVDPSRKWLKEAKEYLEENLYKVDGVTNGKEANSALYKTKYFAVVLNMRVKNHSGVQVLRFIRTNYPGLKLIVTLDKNEMREEQERREYGEDSAESMKEILTKHRAENVLLAPFPLSDLKEMIEKQTSIENVLKIQQKKKSISEEEDVFCTDNEFTKIKIDEFYSSRTVLFDIFVRIKKSHYVKILHANETLPVERIDRYKNEKGVDFFYFRKNDIGKFVKFQNYLAKKMIESNKYKTEVKLSALKQVAVKFLEQSFYEGVHPHVVEEGKILAENVYNLVSKDKELYKVLREYQDFDPKSYSHAYLVTLFSTAIINQFQWQSKSTVETCAFACLFHDIGKLKFPKGLLEKRPDEMSKKEFEIYARHPKDGLEILRGNRLISNSVEQIILQHHEYYDGSGFPYGHSRSKIITLANVVCLTDDFVHRMVDHDVKPLEGIRGLLKSGTASLARYNPLILEGLVKSFVGGDAMLGTNKKAS